MLKWSLSHRSIEVETPKRASKSLNRRKSLASSNKENIVTSTPLRKFPPQITDILNIATESPPKLNQHSSVYASTLPKFEEEYSPSIGFQTGQVLAMRGLLPDRYLGNPRYLAKEFSGQDTTVKDPPTLSSSKMGDFTLDKLIDAILDSSRKGQKKRPRRSMNLRRRTLLKNTTAVEVLSPSYTPADDPASDLCFSEDKILKRRNSSPRTKCSKISSRLNCPRKCKESSENASYLEVGLALPSLYV